MTQHLHRSVSAAIERATPSDVSGERTQWFRLVTPTVDRHGTIVRPEGVKTDRFAQNPVFLWMHETGGGWSAAPSPDVVIGRVVRWDQSEEAFDILVEFDTHALAEECLRKVKAGLLRMTSIGFTPIKVTRGAEVDGERLPDVYDEVELLECSLVIVGSNPEALALARSVAALRESMGAAANDVALPDTLRTMARSFADALGAARALSEPATSEQSAAGEGVVGEGANGADATGAASVEGAASGAGAAESTAPIATYLPPTERAAPRSTETVGQADPSAFIDVATPKAGEPKKGRPMVKMNSESRYVMRRALSHAVDGADMHTYAMAMDGMADEHKAMHREMAGECLRRASQVVKMLRADHEEPDGDEGGMVRTAPSVKDADLAAQYASLLTDGRGLFVRTVGQVVKDTLGDADADTVEAKIEALKMRSARYDEVRKTERADAKARESAEREKLIADLLTRSIITPALANKARGINPATGQADPSIEAWSVAKLERFAAEAGEPVVQITRTAPLVGDAGQPVGEIRQAAPVVKDLSEVPAEILELGKYAGLSEVAIRENYARQVAAIRR